MAAIRDAQGNLVDINPDFLKTALEYKTAPLLSAETLRSIAETGQPPSSPPPQDPDARFKTVPPEVHPVDVALAEAQRYRTRELGPSARAVRDLDQWITQNLPGAAPSPLSQRAESVEPGKVVARAQPAAATGAKSDISPVTVIGSEFGEVDNPAHGGYTEQGWNIGKWGDPLHGADNQGIALPTSALRPFGNVDAADFAKNFNANYDVQIINPKTGKFVSAPLKDIGPGKSTGAGIDMLMGTRAALGFEPNFKGGVQYRVVPKGSAAPEGTQLTSAGGGGDGAAAALGPIELAPLDRSKIRVPAGRNDLSAEEVGQYARSQADDYAAALAKAGTPMTLNEYKDEFKNFYTAAQKQNVGLQPERLPTDQNDALSSLHQGLDLVQDIYDKQRVLWDKVHPPVPGIPIGIPIDQTSEYKKFDAARQLAMSTLARGVGGQKGILTDNDIKIMKDALPNEHDTPDQAAAKMDILKNQSLTMMKGKLSYLRAAHYDTEEFDRNYDQALSKFKSSPTQAPSPQTDGLDTTQKTSYWAAQNEKASKLAKPVQTPTPQQPNVFDTTTNQTLPPATAANPHLWGFGTYNQ